MKQLSFMFSFISASLMLSAYIRQVLVIFPFSKRSDSYLIWQFCFFCFFYHNEHDTFSKRNSIPISWLYIFIVCIKVSSSFCKYLDIIIIIITLLLASFSHQH